MAGVGDVEQALARQLAPDLTEDREAADAVRRRPVVRLIAADPRSKPP